MAKAFDSVVKVTKTVEVDERTIILHLSEDEALTLRVILANVGGDPLLSRRKHANAIDDGLATLGIRPGVNHPSIPNVPSGIIFKNGV